MEKENAQTIRDASIKYSNNLMNKVNDQTIKLIHYNIYISLDIIIKSKPQFSNMAFILKLFFFFSSLPTIFQTIPNKQTFQPLLICYYLQTIKQKQNKPTLQLKKEIKIKLGLFFLFFFSFSRFRPQK